MIMSYNTDKDDDNLEQVGFDHHGYLRNPKLWNEEMAEYLAEQEGLELNDTHWAILFALRQYYSTYESVPSMKSFVNYLKDDLKRPMNSAQLNNLFPRGPIAQGAKIAGLPKPRHCV